MGTFLVIRFEDQFTDFVGWFYDAWDDHVENARTQYMASSMHAKDLASQLAFHGAAWVVNTKDVQEGHLYYASFVFREEGIVYYISKRDKKCTFAISYSLESEKFANKVAKALTKMWGIEVDLIYRDPQKPKIVKLTTYKVMYAERV